MHNSEIPSIEECFSLMDRYQMFPNIRDHSLMVAATADILMQAMENFQPVPQSMPEKDLVIAGALLHDIAKSQCLHGKCRHDIVGSQICEEHGYPRIARIVLEHVYLRDYPEEQWKQGIFTAEELVFYADKRVNHDKSVSLEERLEYILERYGQQNKKIEKMIGVNFTSCKKLEASLFRYINFPPAKLAKNLEESSFYSTRSEY